MKRKITIFSPVFPPEKGASPGRMYRLAKLLTEHGYHVEVVCYMPNYPTGKIFDGYKGSLLRKEQYHGITVKRIWAYPSNSANAMARMFSMATQAISIGLYGICSFPFRKPGLVIINTPPLLSAYAASVVSAVSRQKILLNVSDIWPLTALEMGAIKKGTFYNLLTKIERRLYGLSQGFIGQSRQIINHLEKANPGAGNNSFLYYNLQEHTTDATGRRTFQPAGKRRIVYAGLLGVAQGVYEICEQINFAALQLELHIYGEGNEKDKITEFINSRPGCSIFYHGSVPASKIPAVLQQFDATLVPLKTVIHGALPSKIFMAMAHGLPVLFSADGEGADIIQEYSAGWVNKAGDYTKLRQNLMQLSQCSAEQLQALHSNGVKAATNVFDKEKQDAAFLAFVAQFAASSF